MHLMSKVRACTSIKINPQSLNWDIFTKMWKSDIFLERRKLKIPHKCILWTDDRSSILKLGIVPERQLNLLQIGVFLK